MSVSGSVSCTTVNGGQPVGPGLDAGSYPIDGSSCSGLTVPAGDVLVYDGGAFTVSQASQAISFTAPATGSAGRSAVLSGTGGGSGNSVLFAVDAASGTPAPTYALAAGAPSWLSVSASTGQVTGTPPRGTTSFSYSVTAANAGPAAAGPLAAAMLLPAPVSEVSCTSSCTRHRNVLIWTVPSMAVGASARFAVTVKASAAGRALVLAVAAASNPDPRPGNNITSALITIRR